MIHFRHLFSCLNKHQQHSDFSPAPGNRQTLRIWRQECGCVWSIDMISGSGFPPFLLAWPIITAALPGAAWSVPDSLSGPLSFICRPARWWGLVRFEPGQAALLWIECSFSYIVSQYAVVGKATSCPNGTSSPKQAHWRPVYMPDFCGHEKARAGRAGVT